MKSGEPGPEGSLGKWLWADINQALTTLAMDVKGPRAQLVDDTWTYRFLRARANSIEAPEITMSLAVDASGETAKDDEARTRQLTPEQTRHLGAVDDKPRAPTIATAGGGKFYLRPPRAGRGRAEDCGAREGAAVTV